MAVLRLAPADALAGQTKVQLLIAVDRYPAAISLLREAGNGESSLEHIYCLYKTGRVAEAAEGLAALCEDAAEERAVRLLEAQVVRCRLALNDLEPHVADSLMQKYRSEDFEGSRDVYDDLLATVDAVR